MTADEFPMLDDADRLVILDALFDGRPEVVAVAERMLAAAGLGPVANATPVRRVRGFAIPIADGVFGVDGDQWARPLPRNMDLHEQPGHPRPARLILAEIDSPEGRGAIANEERRRARAASRVTVSPSRFGTAPWALDSGAFVNPPYGSGIADAVKRGIAVHAAAAGRGISIGGRAGKTEAAREWRDLAALVTTTHNTPSMLAAARLAFLPRELVELADEMQQRENRALLENLHRKDSK